MDDYGRNLRRNGAFRKIGAENSCQPGWRCLQAFKEAIKHITLSEEKGWALTTRLHPLTSWWRRDYGSGFCKACGGFGTHYSLSAWKGNQILQLFLARNPLEISTDSQAHERMWFGSSAFAQHLDMLDLILMLVLLGISWMHPKYLSRMIHMLPTWPHCHDLIPKDLSKCQWNQCGIRRYKSRNVYDQLMAEYQCSLWKERKRRRWELLQKIQNPPLVVWQHLWWFLQSLTTFPAIAHTALQNNYYKNLENVTKTYHYFPLTFATCFCWRIWWRYKAAHVW